MIAAVARVGALFGEQSWIQARARPSISCAGDDRRGGRVIAGASRRAPSRDPRRLRHTFRAALALGGHGRQELYRRGGGVVAIRTRNLGQRRRRLFLHAGERGMRSSATSSPLIMWFLRQCRTGGRAGAARLTLTCKDAYRDRADAPAGASSRRDRSRFFPPRSSSMPRPSCRKAVQVVTPAQPGAPETHGDAGGGRRSLRSSAHAPSARRKPAEGHGFWQEHGESDERRRPDRRRLCPPGHDLSLRSRSDRPRKPF